MSRWLVKLRKWRRLSRRERRTARLAWVLLPLVSLSIKWAGLTKTMRWLTRRIDKAATRAETVPADFPARAAQLVSLAAYYHPFKSACLARSVTLWYLLARKGIDSAVRIGVTRDAGLFGAHAWVEMDGTVLLDGLNVTNRYHVIL